MALDMLKRKLNVGDYVVFTNNIYQVVEIPAANQNDWAYCRIILLNKSKSTRTVKKYSREMCLIPGEDVTAWRLKEGF